ncbi:AEC family transporter [Robbsia sp. Bb-Pol-6]|uniref:AEC family transporter n=1 Tax=Robbsia betulipollinis TaxID=2981849 RepID=A0ABT3ZKG8_9BURK|nr:AEC family transporter [Robbsia betulipollinis]MCY0387026.1 AEC family transporter [Robbsia betulipollinis]
MPLLIATALLPVFLTLALGYFAGYRKLIDNRNVASLNVLLMQFALPLTLFVSIARTPQAVILANGMLALVLGLGMLVTYAVVFTLQRHLFKLSLGDAAIETLTIAFPNFASIGLPLLLPVFGPQAALPVAIAIATGSVTISPLTLALLELHKAREAQAAAAGSAGGMAPPVAVSPVRQFLRALGHSVSKPIFFGPVLGLAVALSGLHLPALGVTALGPLTNITAGIGLFLTGLMLSAQPIRLDGDVLSGTAIKNLLQPLLVYGLVRAFDIPVAIGAQAVLLTAIPSGFFGLVFGVGTGLRPPVAGSTLVVSSLAGIVTLSLAILLLAPR